MPDGGLPANRTRCFPVREIAPTVGYVSTVSSRSLQFLVTLASDATISLGGTFTVVKGITGVGNAGLFVRGAAELDVLVERDLGGARRGGDQGGEGDGGVPEAPIHSQRFLLK